MIDVDFSPEDRDKVYQYLIDRFGAEKTAFIQTAGTLAWKSAIDLIGRALKIPLNEVDRIKDEYEIDPEAAAEKYKDVMYYLPGLEGICVQRGIHAAGIVVSPVSLPDNYGTYWYHDEKSKSYKHVTSINMEEIHEVNLVKYDILALGNISIIKGACDLAGVNYPAAHEINWNDEEVFKDLIKSPVGLFQFTEQSSFDLLRRFEPKSVEDIAIVTAAVRPSGDSYREDLVRKIPHKNPSPQIDNLLAKNNGYLIFQCDIIKFLQDICGLSGSEADNVRRAIGRKDKERLDKALPDILNGYCSKSDKPRQEAEEEAKEFLQILEDASSYMFSHNHAIAYSMVTYMCAYYRYHYPLQFLCSYLENSTKEKDIVAGMELAKLKGIKIIQPRFRYAYPSYYIRHETNSIYKGLSSIKYINKPTGTQLMKLKDNQYDSFTDLLYDISKLKVSSDKIEILIKLNFFAEFGRSKTLMDVYDVFSKYAGRSQVSKDAVTPFSDDDLAAHSTLTDKLYKDVDFRMLIKKYEKSLKQESFPVKQQLDYETEYTGSPYSTCKGAENYMYCIEVNTKYTPTMILYKLSTGEKVRMKIYKNNYYQADGTAAIIKGTLFKVHNTITKDRVKKVGANWVPTGEKEQIITLYEIVDRGDENE